ncbi:MAG: L,D-transpeptidase [Chitinophagaceae bacterium]|nr:L,D-transpeptidase [Chitinophagaceae bacterium]
MMNTVRNILLIASFILLCIPEAGAQRRQADSLKQKQIEYNKIQAEKARKFKEEAEQKNRLSKTVVVQYDSKGNKIETATDKMGQKVTTTTITIPSVLNKPFNADTIDKDSISIKVLKAKYRLQVFYKGKILTAYKCVFGPNCTLQKMQEGDRRTPEGTFTILDVKEHDKWEKFMLLDYPNEESRRIFEQAKANGLIPANARIGGSVGIHGIWMNGDNVIDLKHNWTDGCVSLKNSDVEELAKIIKPGVTKITIVR